VLSSTSTTAEEMLSNQGVTESNMMQYLGIIEQKTIEILQKYAESQVRGPGRRGRGGRRRGVGDGKIIGGDNRHQHPGVHHISRIVVIVVLLFLGTSSEWLSSIHVFA
jgi:hypothetical protein